MAPAAPRPLFELDIDDTVEVWPQRRDTWMYVSVPEDDAQRVTELYEARPHGFRSVPVTAEIDGERWTTALFRYRDGTWALPLKASVRRRHHLQQGSSVRVHLAVLP